MERTKISDWAVGQVALWVMLMAGFDKEKEIMDSCQQEA